MRIACACLAASSSSARTRRAIALSVVIAVNTCTWAAWCAGPQPQRSLTASLHEPSTLGSPVVKLGVRARSACLGRLWPPRVVPTAHTAGGEQLADPLWLLPTCPSESETCSPDQATHPTRPPNRRSAGVRSSRIHTGMPVLTGGKDPVDSDLPATSSPVNRSCGVTSGRSAALSGAEIPTVRHCRASWSRRVNTSTVRRSRDGVADSPGTPDKAPSGFSICGGPAYQRAQWISCPVLLPVGLSPLDSTLP